MPKKVLILVSNAHEIGPKRRRTGNYLPEVAHPYAEFDRAKYQIDFASLTGDTPFLDALNLANDPDNLAFLVGKGWADMQKAKKLSDVDVSQYDAIFVPGGLAPMVDMPEIEKPVMTTIGYHVRAGKHDVTAYDWARYLDFADRHLGRKRQVRS